MARLVIGATWDDCPHLSDRDKVDLIASIPPYQRDARTRGIPQLGSGAIYPFPESGIRMADVPIPKHWRRGFGFDCALAGTTAAVWGALDPETQVLYIYSVYKRTQAETAVHAQAFLSRGKWIPGVGDAADIIDEDRQQFLDAYKTCGVDAELPNKGVETGIQAVYDRFSNGLLKVFSSCEAFFAEFRLYRRDEKGRVVKKNDHIMDACVRAGTRVATPEGPVAIEELVGKSGEVFTRAGAIARFCGARKTLDDVEVVTVKFENGYEVTCTPDHPFLTPLGWTRADQMAGRKCYNGITSRVHWKSFWSRLFRRHASSFKACVSTCAAVVILGAEELFYTEPSIADRSVRYRPDSTFITRTRTALITRFGIWNSKRNGGTSQITTEDTAEESQWRLSRRLKHGIEVSPGFPGTKSTINPCVAPFIVSRSLSASTVRESSRRWLSEQTSSARLTVEPRLGARLALTARNAIAWGVASLLWRIATCAQRHAAEDVAVDFVVSVRPAGRADVYCLTVPGTSSFCLENGAVVHNTRYLVHSGLERMKKEPVPESRRTSIVIDQGAGSASLGWMKLLPFVVATAAWFA